MRQAAAAFPALGQTQLDNRIETRAGNVRASDLGMFGGSFQSDQVTIRRQCACQPDGAVGSEGANLKNGTGTGNLSEELQQLALIRSHTDRWQACCGTGFQSCLQPGVGRYKQIVEVTVDRGPFLLAMCFLVTYVPRFAG